MAPWISHFQLQTPAPQRSVGGWLRRAAKFTSLLIYTCVLLLSLLGGSLYSIRILDGLRNFVGVLYSENVCTSLGVKGAEMLVVFASAGSPTEKADKGQPQQAPKKHDEQEPARRREFREHRRRSHTLPGTRPDEPSPLDDILWSHGGGSSQPSASTPWREPADSASSRPPETHYAASDSAARRFTLSRKGERVLPVGCSSNARQDPLPLFTRMHSMGEEATCQAPAAVDYSAYDTDDEFCAASVDETADAGLCSKSFRSVSLSRSTGDLFEGIPDRRAASPFITRAARWVRAFPAQAPRLAAKAQSLLRRRRRTGSRTSTGTPEPPARGEGEAAVTADTAEGRVWHSRGEYSDSSPPPSPGTWEDFKGLDQIDIAPPGDEDDGATEVDFMCEDGVSEEDDVSMEALCSYEQTKLKFRQFTGSYQEAINEYYDRIVVPLEPHPSGCAKYSIDTLLSQVRSETSLLHAGSLRTLMHFSVRVLWRGVQLVAVCYPHYSYTLGRNGSTVTRLPHFVRIFEESLLLISKDPGTSKVQRQEQLDAAFKAQSAASQGEAALGAMESVILSGLTTQASDVVDIFKVQDLLAEIDELPHTAKRLLLMLAELCRAAFEMSEPEAQAHLCQEAAAGGAATAEPDLEASDSIKYCRAEALKFARVYNEAQHTAKQVAGIALTLYEKLSLLDLAPEAVAGV